MEIGVPQETSMDENRVAITPAGVYELTKEGHTVYVEHNAGVNSGFTDTDYSTLGATLTYSHEEVFRRAQIVTKVEPPTDIECKYMNDEHFKKLYEYHFALNRKIWNLCIEPLTEQQFKEKLGYSTGSVRNQAVHLLNVDDRWFAGLRGQEVPGFINPVHNTT